MKTLRVSIDEVIKVLEEAYNITNVKFMIESERQECETYETIQSITGTIKEEEGGL